MSNEIVDMLGHRVTSKDMEDAVESELGMVSGGQVGLMLGDVRVEVIPDRHKEWGAAMDKALHSPRRINKDGRAKRGERGSGSPWKRVTIS